MSHRQELQHHRQQLAEARQIISAMQSLAFIEVRRLRRVSEIQQQVVGGIQAIAADFLSFHPRLLPESPSLPGIVLLIGSERGFCGNLNEVLLEQLAQFLETYTGERPGVVACGRKLCERLRGQHRLLATVDGAAVLDEVDVTLSRLIARVRELDVGGGALALTAIYWDPQQETPQVQQLLPPFKDLRDATPEFAYAPQLNLEPRQLLLELADQYLFAALHEILYVSLTAENLRRMQHLEGAVRHLDNNLETLQHRENQLRQEEIIEEIEVILLSVDSATLAPAGK
ncbi:F-type H+-transporting ATPase subunit gamma [Microbulbifer donghaiensis]|uniref:F-type H+-transporting ATPase subunit gamma n=1 Tax=Microbulbifer donghaiensis TaxID=494016 RepID=A0A1M4UMZ3_9GAMM|nr:F0F1 ATP synthase subunit gamma [Microbulbifer donghaiensis]SHE57943.1 F-type H+-transporting ATPase subunit gamma [Microbulbifer donghaiensis]